MVLLSVNDDDCLEMLDGKSNAMDRSLKSSGSKSGRNACMTFFNDHDIELK